MKTEAVWSRAKAVRLHEYVGSITVVVFVFAVKLTFNDTIGYQTPLLLFTGALILIARFTRERPALVALMLTTLGANFFFLAPFNSFSWSPEPLAQTLVFASEALCAVILTTKLRSARAKSDLMTARVERLQSLTSNLLRCTTIAEISTAIASESTVAFRTVLVGVYCLLPAAEQPILIAQDGTASTIEQDRILTAAHAVIGRSFGADMQDLWISDRATLDLMSSQLDPVELARKEIAALSVIRVEVGHRLLGLLFFAFSDKGILTSDNKSLIRTFADQYAQACDRARVYEAQREALVKADLQRQEAQAANQVKDEFLGVVSHELRTPLHAILGWTQLLEGNRSKQSQDIKTGLQVIRRNAESQGHIIESLLDMSQVLAGKLKLDVRPVELPALLASLVESVTPIADDKRIVIRLDVERTARVMGDEPRLRQVFLNVLTNALRFTPAGGEVTVSVRAMSDTATVSIADTGRGLSKAHLTSIFDRFRQVDGSSTRDNKGLGLGLALAKNLLEAQRGQIRAESDGLGYGATFIIELPLTRAPENILNCEPKTRSPLLEESSFALTHPALPLKDVNVLVVDDEHDAADLIMLMLKRKGANVRVANSVYEAVRLFDRFTPDVLISDIGMPGQDGFELLRNIRSRWGHLGQMPAIAVTAYGRREDIEKTADAGFHSHLTKPVNEFELITAVKQTVPWMPS